MTGRTTSTTGPEHGLTVLQGGMPQGRDMHDEHGVALDADWLARELDEAARLADRLADEGRRIAFATPGNGAKGVRVSVRDLLTDHLVRDLDTRDAVDVNRLLHLNGMSG